MKPSAYRTSVQNLALFRYSLRRFLRFSEDAARICGVTPQQHQLMLGVAGFTEAGSATISELAEFLQEKRHSVVGLVDRAVLSGLVQREKGSTDGRKVMVSLTPKGRGKLHKLIVLHEEEAGFMSGDNLLPWERPEPLLKHHDRHTMAQQIGYAGLARKKS